MTDEVLPIVDEDERDAIPEGLPEAPRATGTAPDGPDDEVVPPDAGAQAGQEPG